MPHSSGGGSSHGGSHSSSHSSSSWSSSSRSSSSSVPARRVSTSYFRGARTYVRYINGRPDYRYSNQSLTKSITNYIPIIFFLGVFILNGISSIFASTYTVKKLSDAGVENAQVEVFDENDILGDTSNLMNSLNAFKEETGIIPAVLAIENSEWQDQGYDLERYVYNWYVYNWSDEKHWLIVYSEEVGSDDTFGNWYWEGMQGDLTDSIITVSVADTFTNTCHNNMIAGGRYTKADAIANAFDTIRPGLIGTKVRWGMIVRGALEAGIAGIILFVILKHRKKENDEVKDFKEVKNVQMQPNNIPLEDTCAYCDGVYVVGTVLSCPHCGAAIPAHNPINKQQSKY